MSSINEYSGSSDAFKNNSVLDDTFLQLHGIQLGLGYLHNITNITETPGLQHSTNMEFYKACRIYDFMIEAVCMGILCLFGFCGNSLSMACLLKDKSKTATPFLLASLEVADTLFLIAVLILRVLKAIQVYTDWFPILVVALPYTGKYIYPCALMAETGTVYLTILVTVNRYISVCRPYEASDLCSMKHAKKHVILVAFFSIVFNIPRFFENQVIEMNDIHKDNQTINALLPTDLKKNKIYQIIYSNVLYFVVMFLIPLVTLVILNYKLIRALRKTKKKRAKLISTSSDSHSRSEDDITLILIVVVLVFVVCQTPALVTQVLVSLLNRKQRHCPKAYFYYERISDLLVVANSSLNFLIYCFCSTKFRQILLELICKQKLHSPEASNVSRRGMTPSPLPPHAGPNLTVPMLNETEVSSLV